MQKTKVVFTTLIIIGLSAISFQGIAIAAQVKKVNKHRGYVYIDGGKADGFVMGAEVCFYSSSGEKIVCGYVQSTTNSQAMVNVNPGESVRIIYGMEARLSGEKRDKKGIKEKPICVSDADCNCIGTATPCSEYSNQIECNQQAGCKWDATAPGANGVCISITNECSRLNISDCPNRDGCSNGICVNGKCL